MDELAILKNLITGRFTICQIDQCENGYFKRYYGVRCRGSVQTAPDGQWKFKTVPGASAAIRDIKAHIRARIAVLEA